MALLRPDAGGALTENESIRESQNEATKVGGATPTFDRSQDLRNFMYAVHRYEGQSWGGSTGAYGFPKGKWNDMATAAGLKGASMTDRAAQTYVAAYWMNNLYQRYRNWGLVAVAWQKGAGAAEAIVKQIRKEPAKVTYNDIASVAPDVMGFVGETTKWSNWAAQKGGIPEDYVKPQRVSTVGASAINTTITGSGFNAVEDPYAATVRALYEEGRAEQNQRRPSGAEMLFAQLDTLSNVVSGGKGRADWRLDTSQAESGGNPNELIAMERIGQEEEGEG